MSIAPPPSVILENTIKVVAEMAGLEISDVDASMTLAAASECNNLGFDSFEMIELVMAIEDEFDIEILNEDWEQVKTVQDAANVVAKYVI